MREMHTTTEQANFVLDCCPLYRFFSSRDEGYDVPLSISGDRGAFSVGAMHILDTHDFSARRSHLGKVKIDAAGSSQRGDCRLFLWNWAHPLGEELRAWRAGPD